ncbi:MAG: hypothetical protein JXQ73_33630 [Phycisphaerae bacterium]|nr:hypothetical protein [Phycisphaerae bacterium]
MIRPYPSFREVLAAALLLGAFCGGCASSGRRDEILQIARRYAGHEWRATRANVFHGLDGTGQRLDTPDDSHVSGGWTAEGRINVGVPYKWGGFSSIEEFDRGIAGGKYAGCVLGKREREMPPEKRPKPSDAAVGVDCSGFVSRCWRLPNKRTTRSLPDLCVELDSYKDLLPGDILNRYDRHVMLFKGFADAAKTRVKVYEAVRKGVKENEYAVARLAKKGFMPLRYNLLID